MRDSSSTSSSGDDRIPVECDGCGARFKAPARSAGKSGPCPKCGQILTVPEPMPAHVFDDLEEPADASTDDGGYDLADEPESPPVRRPPLAAQGAGMPMSGSTPGTMAPPANPMGYANAAAGGYAQPVPSSSAGAGRFVLGITLALVFAVGASVIWLAIVLMTGYEVGIIASLVGVAVGGGMLLGYGQRTPAAGAISCCIAVFAIVLTKAIPAALIALLGWGISTAGQMSVVPYNASTARFELADLMIDDVLAEQGLDYNITSEAQDAEAYAAAELRVAEMSDEELELAYKRQQVAMCKEMDYFATSLDEDEELLIPYDQFRTETANLTLTECDTFLAAWQPQAGPSFWSSFGGMFSPYDALWMMLALFAAFSISGETT